MNTELIFPVNLVVLLLAIVAFMLSAYSEPGSTRIKIAEGSSILAAVGASTMFGIVNVKGVHHGKAYWMTLATLISLWLFPVCMRVLSLVGRRDDSNYEEGDGALELNRVPPDRGPG